MESLDPAIIGVAVILFVIGSRWLWDYRREIREQSNAHEPKATPPLHKQYVDLGTYKDDMNTINVRFSRASESRKEIHSEVGRVREQISSIKTDNNNQTRELQNLRASVEAMPERIAKLLDRKSL